MWARLSLSSGQRTGYRSMIMCNQEDTFVSFRPLHLEWEDSSAGPTEQFGTVSKYQCIDNSDTNDIFHTIPDYVIPLTLPTHYNQGGASALPHIYTEVQHSPLQNHILL